MIWAHRDLDETECEVFCVPGDVTPEADSTAFRSFFPASPSLPEQPAAGFELTPEKNSAYTRCALDEYSTTPLGTPSAAVLNARSPDTREGALALMDFQQQEVAKTVTGRVVLLETVYITIFRLN